MNQRHKVRLTTSTSFDLERDEIKQLYIYLSLFQYRYMRIPDYPERPLIEKLEKDFNKFCIELQRQIERDPNNLMLSRISIFFEIHHQKLKMIVADYRSQEAGLE